ncbi:hypothetical protein Sjap_008741 [Stephania japonica]|uniref:Uncharacterized protein n=1 Tax=Stephania japonica TaxID=461633 RepID=A0AAP0JQ87_9MAGN
MWSVPQQFQMHRPPSGPPATAFVVALPSILIPHSTLTAERQIISPPNSDF